MLGKPRSLRPLRASIKRKPERFGHRQAVIDIADDDDMMSLICYDLEEKHRNDRVSAGVDMEDRPLLEWLKDFFEWLRENGPEIQAVIKQWIDFILENIVPIFSDNQPAALPAR